MATKTARRAPRRKPTTVTVSFTSLTRLVSQVGKVAKGQEQVAQQFAQMNERLDRLNLNGSAKALHALADHADILIESAKALQEERQARDYDRKQLKQQADAKREYDLAHPLRARLRQSVVKGFWIGVTAIAMATAGFVAGHVKAW